MGPISTGRQTALQPLDRDHVDGGRAGVVEDLNAERLRIALLDHPGRGALALRVEAGVGRSGVVRAAVEAEAERTVADLGVRLRGQGDAHAGVPARVLKQEVGEATGAAPGELALGGRLRGREDE